MYTSNAEWPAGTVSGTITTKDEHDTLERAKAVCDRLESEGLGGEGSVFPIRTWVVDTGEE